MAHKPLSALPNRAAQCLNHTANKLVECQSVTAPRQLNNYVIMHCIQIPMFDAILFPLAKCKRNFATEKSTLSC